MDFQMNLLDWSIYVKSYFIANLRYLCIVVYLNYTIIIFLPYARLIINNFKIVLLNVSS